MTTAKDKSFKFRVQYRATKLTYIVEAKDLAGAEKKLRRLLNKTDGADHLYEIIYID